MDHWAWRGRKLPWPGRPVVMGVLNLTPDSFSDGGRFTDVDAALEQARRLEQEGADILDLGAQSTRPGAVEVGARQELERLLPVLEPLLEQSQLPISVDTNQVEVAREALSRGCHAINDTCGLRDAAMAEAIAEAQAGVVIMHMRGAPRTMQDAPYYDDVVSEVAVYLEKQAEGALAAGISASGVVLDPGIGFGKRLAHNLSLLHHLPRLVALGFPVLVGTSRKSFLGELTGRRVEEREAGTLASVAAAVLLGAAGLRVHRVAEAVDAARVAAAIRCGSASQEDPG